MSVPAGQAQQPSLMADLDISEQEIAQRKEFLQFFDEDVTRLLGVNDLARAYADPVIEDFYQHLLSFEETRVFFQNPQVLEYVKRMQKEYFLRLTKGDYNSEYIEIASRSARSTSGSASPSRLTWAPITSTCGPFRIAWSRRTRTRSCGRCRPSSR